MKAEARALCECAQQPGEAETVRSSSQVGRVSKSGGGVGRTRAAAAGFVADEGLCAEVEQRLGARVGTRVAAHHERAGEGAHVRPATREHGVASVAALRTTAL